MMLHFLKKTYRIIATICYITFAISAYIYMDKSNKLDQNKGKGEFLYTARGCTTCHGKEGKNPIAPYPKVNNQPAEYIADQIMGIKNSQRSGAKTALMRPVVQNLTEKEIDEIAKYLSSID